MPSVLTGATNNKWLKSKLESQLSSALSSLNPFSPVEHGGELFIGMPLVKGAISALAGLGPALSDSLTSGIRAGVGGLETPPMGLGGSDALSSRSSSSSSPALVLNITGNTMLGDSYETAERLARLVLPHLSRVITT